MMHVCSVCVFLYTNSQVVDTVVSGGLAVFNNMATKSYGTPKEVFSGVLYKCGARVKSWNKRWMILKDDSCLYYHKDANKKPQGVISLR